MADRPYRSMSPAEVEHKSQKELKERKKHSYYFERLRDALGKKDAEKATRKPTNYRERK